MLAVAFLALLITGSGLLLSRCGAGKRVATEPQIEEIMAGNGSEEAGAAVGKERTDTVRKSSRKGNKKMRHPKRYRRRSHRDEPVSGGPQ